ncbi:MAG: hypothetical protein IJW98_06020 [Clostridia bacterium]|nr:hypothetical protein [Clostridia bacterium]
MPLDVKVAICGELPTAYQHLLRQGVVQIDQYMDATELTDESEYHLILIYAPHAEGLLNTSYTPGAVFGSATDEKRVSIPIRLLNEPCCHSALLELNSMIRRISARLAQNSVTE